MKTLNELSDQRDIYQQGIDRLTHDLEFARSYQSHIVEQKKEELKMFEKFKYDISQEIMDLL